MIILTLEYPIIVTDDHGGYPLEISYIAMEAMDENCN